MQQSSTSARLVLVETFANHAVLDEFTDVEAGVGAANVADVIRVEPYLCREGKE